MAQERCETAADVPFLPRLKPWASCLYRCESRRDRSGTTPARQSGGIRDDNGFEGATPTPVVSEISPERLLPTERMRRQALDGEVTQIHRGQRYAEQGDTFSIDGTVFEVVAVEGRTLGDLTDADARAEGARDLEQYRRILERAHDGFEWDDDSGIVRHRFDRRD